MPSIINADKIGTLSYSAPNVTLGPSLVTVGGQQYRTLTNLTANTGTLTANTLYCVYVVISGGAPQLVVSTNVNSAGPAGHTRWTLAGAFLTGYAGTFGQFIQIDTRTPVIVMKATKGSTAISSVTAFIITNWLTTTDPFFDATNGFFRPPIAGLWELYTYMGNSAIAGTPNTLINNLYTLGSIKASAPANPLDTTDNFGDDNGPWFTSTNATRRHLSVNSLAAGAYVWQACQSNSTGVSLLSSLFIARLDSIPVAIKDM